jgi:putative SOS response-associated peptidase YedK
MCGRYVSPEEAAIERFWLVRRGSSNPFLQRFNVAPTTTVPILMYDDDGALLMQPARWGLVPHWWSKDKLPSLTFNARSEEVAGKRMWRLAYRTARCLIPACGWYEWKTVKHVDTRTGEIKPIKQPYYLHSKDGDIFAFAGLMSRYTGRDGQSLFSCSILTKAAAPSVQDVHDRMPVVLKSNHQHAWCERNIIEPEQVAAMIVEASNDFVHPVSTRVNGSRTDGAELLQPLTSAS